MMAPSIPRSERTTQNRVVQLFTSSEAQSGLGYEYLGNLSQRVDNRGIDIDRLCASLQERRYSNAHITTALQKLLAAADVSGVTPYEANQRTYQLLRYGIPVQVAAGKAHETVALIDWEHPERNHFALAEEVRLRGADDNTRRPDIVLYINGMAMVVLELKRASVDVGEAIRQLISNQDPLFHPGFFSTVQLLLAGNDSQGLRYGTTGTQEKYYLQWKDEHPDSDDIRKPGTTLDRPLTQLCSKARLLDIIRYFVIFDGCVKKVPRQHQYQGIKAAQERIGQREGGVIWHTQGSGKSILMVLLAKWLLEQDARARILIVTDRDELDRQIEGVMRNAGVLGSSSPSPRITSRAELVRKLEAPSPRLLCALIHKFDTSDLQGPPPNTQGNFYVLVDECHRTQGGDMNHQMKRWLSSAIFIGFTGTPLLRQDRQTTRDVFGTYIHTYKHHQAVEDGVVLDLKYEAREVPQQLSSRKKIDSWFETKTRGLNNYQKATLRKRWATLQNLMSSKERKDRIVADIIEDFETKPRLTNNRGTAILVADDIYDACHYFRLFHETPFRQHVGIITSYEPTSQAIANAAPNSDERYKYDTYKNFVLKGGKNTQQYEEETKRDFIKKPADMKLLIVVSKLLTGFDAPSCTYIYLDKKLRDHNLFQAICRTNRLDGEDKDYGHIVDYERQFQDVQNVIAVYNSDELDTDTGSGGSNNVELKDWIKEGRKQLDEARETLAYLCEPVQEPRDVEQYIHHFCGLASDPQGLDKTEPLRIAYYRAVATYLRAFAEMAANLTEAGYSATEADKLQKEAAFHTDTRQAIKNASGEELDTKPYEADMRHLINTYIKAEESEKLGGLEDLSLTDLIIKTGIHDAIARRLNQSGKLSNNAIAETIINNVRKTIIRDHLTDPRFYDKMSKLLDDLIQQNRDSAEAYEEFLQKAEALARQLTSRQSGSSMPDCLHGNPAAQVIYRNLPDILATNKTPENTAAEPSPEYGDQLAQLALKIDRAMQEEAPANWRGDSVKENQVKNLLHPLTGKDGDATLKLFELIRNQSAYP